MNRRTMILASLLAGAAPASAQAASRSPRELQSAVRAFARDHSFNGVALVERRGELLYNEAFGVAERRFATPMRIDTRFWIASITKSFTAVLLLQLHEEGRIDLQAPLGDYLADYAGPAARRSTIHSLLNHTSGIANMDTIRSYDEAVRNGMPAYQIPHTSDDLVRLYASGPLQHEVGSTFDYNNADYIILGKIIERVSGHSFEDILQERLLGPLGLRDTGMLRQSMLLPRLASTYFQPPGEAPLVNDLPVYPENWYAAGGMYSTANDLRVFADALYGGRLLHPETLNLMLTPGLDGYGYSVWVWEIEAGGRRYRTAERFGSIMGANGAMFRILGEDITIVLLSNTNLTDMRDFAVHTANALLG